MSDEVKVEHKYYGYVNSWKETPQAVAACEAAGHVLERNDGGRCIIDFNCPICGIGYSVDSGD